MKDLILSRSSWLRHLSNVTHWKTMLLLLVLCVGASANAQNITVSGTVTDATGEPMIGATVQVDGTQNAIATDIDGNYTLKNVNPKGKLIVSYIGYQTQTVSINGQSHIDVTLSEDSEVLDEVVVVGYGTIKKTDLTGSVSTVGTEKLNAKGAPSALENIQGTVPGVNITKSSGRAGGGMEIEIRGKSSFNSDTKPLFVVDGVICGDIDFLNPQDIERIDVLKDASSTAIYGSRATAGVVMVTTKGGMNVNKNFKTSISYDGYYGFNKASHKPKFMEGQDWYYYRFGKFLSPMGGDNNYGAQTAHWMKPASYGLGQALLQEKIADLQSPYVMKRLLAEGNTTDWIDLVTRDGSQQNHYVAIAGAGEKVNYHFGVGYNGEDGIYEGDSQKMFSFKGSVDARVNKVLSGGFTVNLAQIKNKYADGGAIEQAYRVNPYMIPYTEDGKIQHFPGNKNTLGTDDHQFSDFINPLDRMRNASHERTTYRALGNVYLQLDLFNGFNIKSTFSPSYTSYRDGQYVGYTNPETGKTYVDNDVHTATRTNSTGFSWTWDNIASYNRTFNKVHSINAMGLVSLSKWTSEKSTWIANDVLENSDWWNMGTGTFDGDNSSMDYSEESMLSYALRANYSFMGRYMATATIRWDGSSKFADGYKWGSFPSFALAWRASEEPFLRDLTWMTNLKLRLAYGVTGNNAGVGRYGTIVGIGSTPTWYPWGSQWVSGLQAAGVVDKAIQWEKSKEWNLGLDFGFLRDRITGSVDIYQKTSDGLLTNVSLPLVTGGMGMYTNAGSVRNRGLELAVTTVNVDNRNLTWTTSLTFARNINKVLEIDGITDAHYTGKSTGNYWIGSPVNNVYQYAWQGVVSDRPMVVPDHEIAVKKGFEPGATVRECDYYWACYGIGEGQPKLLDRNGDGAIDDDDKVIVNGDPKWTASFSSNLNYRLPKNFGSVDFGFTLYAKYGYWVDSSFLRGDYYDLHDRGRGKMQMDYYIPAGTIVDAEGIRPDGTFINPVYQTTTHYGKYPMLSGGTNDGLGALINEYQASRGLEEISFCKVKNITVGYTFAPKLLKKIQCQNLRLYFTVTNPFIWTKYEGFDPEWAGASGKNDGPSVTSYQIGANIKF